MESSSRLANTWELKPRLTDAFFAELKHTEITSIQAQLLANRGIHNIKEMQAFITASYEATLDPLALIDMPRAVERIRKAIEQAEHITVYGDYDADGVTSSALLYRVLRQLKHPHAKLDHHIPNRLKNGCGLNDGAIEMLKARGTSLIITTDCASSDVSQVALANKLGIDVIITDHHHPPAELPEAYAMVNPWRPDCTYGERNLCGVGIAFKLSQALYRAYNRPANDEMDLLDLVAIGTVADIAPLLGENHTYVRLGLARLNATHKPGLQALIRNANLQPGRIRERDIAFGIAPCINAAGRMKEASIAFELLVTDDSAEAERIAEELKQLNIQRQQETEILVNTVREQASKYPDDAVILVHGANWHEGIIGLVAGKMAEELDKPVLVLSDDPVRQTSRGSARSQKGFNIIEALRDFRAQLERYGGHKQAAGFTIRSTYIEDLRVHLLQWYKNGGAAATTLIDGSDIPDPTGIVTEQETSENAETLTPHMVDLTITQTSKLDYKTYKELRQLGPFGAGNPEPLFVIERLRLLNARASGPNRQNMLMRLAAPQKATGIQSAPQATRLEILPNGIYTRGAHEIARFQDVDEVDVIFRLSSAEDDSKPDVWLKILDVEPSH